MTTIIPTQTLRLSKDIKAPLEIHIEGKITGAYNEVVVIEQLRREIFPNAYVCHVTEGPEGKGIYDMPNFHFIRYKCACSINRRGDINFTMVSIEKRNDSKMSNQGGYITTNWLF